MCVGGSQAEVSYSDLTADDYIFFNTPQANITCWNPSKDTPVLCEEDDIYCYTDIRNGVGQCGSIPASIQFDYALTRYYLTPSPSYLICIPSTGETGGCNNFGQANFEMTASSMNLSGAGKSCWDPSTGGSAPPCKSEHWMCETTKEGVGLCSGKNANFSSYTCSEKSSLCNKVSFCWDMKNETQISQCTDPRTLACRDPDANNTQVCTTYCTDSDKCCYHNNCKKELPTEMVSDTNKIQINVALYQLIVLLFIAYI
jgi:hypothetical protein